MRTPRHFGCGAGDIGDGVTVTELFKASLTAGECHDKRQCSYTVQTGYLLVSGCCGKYTIAMAPPLSSHQRLCLDHKFDLIFGKYNKCFNILFDSGDNYFLYGTFGRFRYLQQNRHCSQQCVVEVLVME